MRISFDVKISHGDLFRFNLMQAYKGTQGILSIILPVLIFIYTGTSYGEVSLGSTILYLGLGIVFLVYVPCSLWLRTKKVVTDPENALSKMIHYSFSEEGILVSVDEESVEFQWENIYQMKTRGDLLLIYTNRMSAYILPLNQLGNNYTELFKLSHMKLEKFRIRIAAENKYV